LLSFGAESFFFQFAIKNLKINTLQMGDADLRSYISTMQDG